MKAMIEYFQSLEQRIIACEQACGIVAPMDSKIREAYKSEGRIPALKVYRAHTGQTLSEAITYVDSLCIDLKTPRI